MSLDMFGFVDSIFVSVIPATRTSYTGGTYVDGIWVPGVALLSEHTINLQPIGGKEIRGKEISFLDLGAERQHDVRKIYVNDGDLYSISESDTWTFETGQGADGNYKTIWLDNRPWRNYCKIIVSRFDDQ